MLTKAATHIRPLLRLQSHAHQPDLFTSNPSLLHHFQPAGVSNGLVAAQNAQTASGASGATGGAGRSGYSGASSGGGYTGHARAFLSLPQGPGADASSLGASAEEKKDAAAARQRAHLALKQRIARREEQPTTRVVMVRDQLSSRTGSRQVKLIEMEPAALEDGSSAPKRSSIAYPAWAALPADATPGGALWLPGAAPRPIGARAFHSRATRPHLVTATPAPETNRIEQPNRVLMDLAGLDIARPTSPTRTQVRRNSTASVVRPSVAEDLPLPAVSNGSMDKAIYTALKDLSGQTGSHVRHQIDDLIAYYRTPRDEQPKNATLAAQLPLPAGFTIQTYNVCMSSLIQTRNRGESIAPILDIYNEMLERDVVPNFLTTALVIKALCLREEDVAAASRRWAHDRDWIAFKSEKLGIESRMSRGDHEAAEALAAYQSEANLASAFKLYNVAVTFYPTREVELGADIITASAAVAGLPFAIPFEKILPVINTSLQAGHITLEDYASIFTLLESGGPSQKELIVSTWEKFIKTHAFHADGRVKDTRTPTRAAVGALVACGEIDMAKDIVKNVTGKASSFVTSAAVAAFAKAGHLDLAYEMFQDAVGKDMSMAPSDLYEVTEALAAAGRFSETVEVLQRVNTLITTSLLGLRLDRNRMTIVWGKALAYVLSVKDKTARVALYDDLSEVLLTCGPRLDPSVLNVHVDLAVEAGKANDAPRLIARFGARHASFSKTDIEILRQIFIKVAFTEDITVPQVLDVTRALARQNVPIHSDGDSKSIAQRIVELYMAARAKTETEGVANIGSVMTYTDQWFRLTEAFASLPAAYLESGAADAALEAFMKDIQSTSRSGNNFLPSKLASSPVVGEVATMLSFRFGPERAAELLTATFGDAAKAFLPTPEASLAPESESTFTLPPTPASDSAPPSNLQPPSAHTLHISPKLDNMIERLIFPSSNTTPERVYGVVRTTLTQTNEVPSPQGLGRLIASIARTGDEPKCRELYSLAQVVLSSCVPEPAAQAEGWCAVEDGMIAACCFLGHLEQAGMHRARIIEAGMIPSPDSYATMIASSRDSTDEALVARDLFEESQAMGVVPNLYLFNTIISKLSKARKAEMALKLFGRMKAQGIRPSSVTYGAVINACCRVGDAESAANLFEEMSAQRNFRPRVPPFNTMMQLHLQTRPSRDQVLHYYDAMRAAHVRPSAHTYKLLLDAYGTLAPIDLPAMDRVFGDLCRDRSVNVQGTHWASLITAFGIHASDLDRALAIFDSIPSHPSTAAGSTPEPVVWEAILNVAGQVGTVEQITKLHERLNASGAQSTAYVSNVLIAGYSRHGALDSARQVFESMGDTLTGFAAPNNHPALLTSSGHVKPSTVTSQPTPLVFREPSTYEAMIRAELAAGNREDAEAVLRRMEERRYPVAVWMKARAIIDDAIVNPSVPPTPQAATTPSPESA